MEPDEIAEAISKLQAEGKIKAFGVSNFTPSQVNLIATKTPISVNQIEFSLTQHTAMENGTLDQMLQHNIQLNKITSSVVLYFAERSPNSILIWVVLSLDSLKIKPKGLQAKG